MQVDVIKTYLILSSYRANVNILVVICLLIFGSNQILAQKIDEGNFFNKNTKEFIFITKDSIHFRITNKDAFGSYCIAGSTYDYMGRNKYQIKSNDIWQETSVLDSLPRKDSTISLIAVYKDYTPIVGAYFYIKTNDESNTTFEILGVSNLEGVLKIDAVVAKRLMGRQLILQIKTIGYTTQQKINMQLGYDYCIKSTMPIEYPFTLFQPGVIILKPLGNDEIEVEIERSKNLRKFYGTSKLKKAKLNEFSKDLIFEIK